MTYEYIARSEKEIAWAYVINYVASIYTFIKYGQHNTETRKKKKKQMQIATLNANINNKTEPKKKRKERNHICVVVTNRHWCNAIWVSFWASFRVQLTSHAPRRQIQIIINRSLTCAVLYIHIRMPKCFRSLSHSLIIYFVRFGFYVFIVWASYDWNKRSIAFI